MLYLRPVSTMQVLYVIHAKQMQERRLQIVGEAVAIAVAAGNDTQCAAVEPDRIPWSGIAFKTTTIALRDWFERRHPEVEVPAISPGR